MPKTLWMSSGEVNHTYEGSNYKLGHWDDETKAWVLTDQFAYSLLQALTFLGWGDPNTGHVPTVIIETRE